MNRTELEHRARAWRRHRAARDAWFSGAAGVAAVAPWLPHAAARAVPAAVAVAAAVWFLRRRGRPTVTAATVAAHLNRLCPALEESAGLWLREPSSLPPLERLQLRRLDEAWRALPDTATLGRPSRRALRLPVACGFAAVLLALLGLGVTGPDALPPPSVAPAGTRPSASAPALPPVVRAAALTIVPPAYTGRPPRRTGGLDAEVEEGAQVTWDFEVEGVVAGVALDGAGPGGLLAAVPLGAGRFRADTTVAETRVYQVVLLAPSGARTPLPGLHALKILRDQPPRLAWREPAAARTLIDPAAGPPHLSVRLAATDDHGLAAVRLVLTLAKGTGEGVKFRERELPLERLSSADGASVDDHGRILELAALGMEPGDELYFHALATDRRTPTPHVARSETRFAVLRGPAAESAAPTALVAGINRLPQYFRSQRQIILDTERLLAERPQLSETQFRARSEELGLDQKLLRLRHGQFLGEEFEPSSSGAPREAQAMEIAATLLRQPRAAAARTAAVERAVEAQHAHEPAPEQDRRPLTFEEMRAPYVHVHDSVEAATLFDSQVKTALRAVLAAMWEAEGHLRTGDPAAALPAEHRALKQLKALQQADRISVRRVGHESAPIAVAARRLRGELDLVPPSARQSLAAPERDPDAAAVQRALAALGRGGPATLAPDDRARVDARLLAAAQAQPDVFLGAVEAWRRAAPWTEAERERTRRVLWLLAPPAGESPHRSADAAPGLARAYADALAPPPGGPP